MNCSLKNTARILSLLTMLFTSQILHSQGKYKLSGTVLDSLTGKGIGYATVALCDTSSKVIAAWACDGNGKFEYTIKIAGKYNLSAASLGYTTKTRSVNITAPTTNVGEFILKAGVEIQGITVSTTKPLIKSDIDKITYSVDADPEAPVNTVLDMLRKVPLVTVDSEDNVQLRGQSNYKVLVNGKSSSLMDRNFKEVVRGMPASSIKDIEIITNPSSKYEAEGVGGIINIITNRKTITGYNGSIGVGGDSFGGYNTNGYINAKFGKFSISSNLSLGKSERPGSSSTSYQINKLSDQSHYVETNGTSKSNDNTNFNYGVEASYEIDTFNLVTLSMWGYNGDYKYGNNSNTRTSDINHTPVMEFNNNNSGSGKYGGLSGSLDYQRTFMKPGKTFTISYKLDNSPNESDYESSIDGVLNYPSYQEKSENDTWSREQTLQVDFVNPIKEKHSLETGTKFILRQNGSDPTTYNRQSSDEEWVFDPLRKNALDYDQYILGLYGSYTYKLKKFSAKAGMRLESTWNDGIFKNALADVPFDNQLFNIVPYINFSYAPKASDRYSLSYTQRLSRPSIWYMNPYINTSDPMNISFGNPNLDSEISHSFNASYGSYGPRVNYSLSANASFTDNSIERVTVVNDNGVSESTYYNIGIRKSYGLNAYYSYRPNAKFSINLNASGNYINVRENDNIKNDGFSYSGNINSRIALWKNGTFNVNGYYSSPNVSLQGKNSAFYFYSFGMSQRMLKDKITMTLSANSPFNKNAHFESEYDTPTFYRSTDYSNPRRHLRLNVSYNFGKTQVQVKKAQRGINNDDLKAGGSSSGGGQ